jgi:hypothetical protein
LKNKCPWALIRGNTVYTLALGLLSLKNLRNLNIRVPRL